MKLVLWMLLFGFLIGCEQVNEAGNKTARELTGSNMIEQKKQIEQKLQGIELQQKQRFEQLDTQ